MLSRCPACGCTSSFSSSFSSPSSPSSPSSTSSLHLRVALRLQYNGAAFSGWEAKPGRRTVQSALESAVLEAYPHLASASVAGSSRTDAGVHAAGQVALLTLRLRAPGEAPEAAPGWLPDPTRVAAALRGRLPPDLSVLDSAPTPFGTWCPRRDAISRRYRYALLESPSSSFSDVFLGGWTWHRPPVGGRRLDLGAIREAMAGLVGAGRDLSAFARKEDLKTEPEAAEACIGIAESRAGSGGRGEERPWRRQPPGGGPHLQDVLAASAHREGPLLLLEVEADHFRYGQMRMLAGALERVGRGFIPPGRFRERAEGRGVASSSASSASAAMELPYSLSYGAESRPAAPAHGLCLMEVRYGSAPVWGGAALASEGPLSAAAAPGPPLRNSGERASQQDRREPIVDVDGRERALHAALHRPHPFWDDSETCT